MALYLPEDLVPKMFAPLSHLELLIPSTHEKTEAKHGLTISWKALKKQNKTKQRP